ncbi:N-acetylglucosaminyltransferase-like protein [Corchorus olitorius]|uniref:N-acetylglucosaminyltransferase-like protein n=1 Tax=Corchorus olitorius TaxID=93759 RepID=A0A1R3KJA2_9ROSI|nr:N-acetylglucosaminyltransferase-like protein [Corchorus olitorius]
MAKHQSIDGVARALLKRIARKEKEERQAPILDEDMDIDDSNPNKFPSK